MQLLTLGDLLYAACRGRAIANAPQRVSADSDKQAFDVRSGLVAVRVGLEKCGFSPG